jgi:hypothetical protein
MAAVPSGPNWNPPPPPSTTPIKKMPHEIKDAPSRDKPEAGSTTQQFANVVMVAVMCNRWNGSEMSFDEITVVNSQFILVDCNSKLNRY